MDFSSIPILATAISIVIAWALFAILCSQINEAFSQLLAERGRFMRKYLLMQLKDLPNGINWGSLLYTNGSINLLSREPGKPTSDMPSDLFAKTIIEIAGSSHIVQSKMAAVAGSIVYQQQTLKNFKAATLVLNPSGVVGLWQQALNDAELKATQVNQLVDESQLYQFLLQNISAWHSQLMDRVTLWYQKKTRQRLLILGMILAALLNIDSIQLFIYFNSNSAARTQMIDFYSKNKTQLENEADKFRQVSKVDSAKKDAAHTAAGQTVAAVKSDSTKTAVDTNKTAQLKAMAKEINLYATRLDSLQKAAQLPIGVSKGLVAMPFKNKKNFLAALNVKRPANATEAAIGWDSAAALFWKILGVIITGIAVSFGAPFWFDLLKKVYTKK